MQGHLEIQNQIRQSFEAQQIGPAALRMTTMTQALQLTLLAGAQTAAAPSQVGLLQRLSNQAPAERSPRDSPGRRVRYVARRN